MKKRIISLILTTILVLTVCIPSYASQEALTPQIYDVEIIPPLFSPRSIDTSEDNISINGGSSKTWNFNTKTGTFGWGDIKHNAFTVEVTNISSNAKYTVAISYDGVEMWNEQYTTGVTVYVSQCSPDQKWKVMVINDRTASMTCDVSIISYVK